MNEDVSVELARWLQETGRRRYKPRVPVADARPCPQTPGASPLRATVLLLAGAAAVAQYCYADTMLGILSIRSVLVFVFTGVPQ